jgi:3-oxoacyl-[acyl-carrier protein] reductase
VNDSRRIALVADAAFYVGPDLARQFASRGHDLVLGSASDDLVAELTALGARVVNVPGASNLAKEESAPALVAAALENFGRLDAAVGFSGAIVPGRFMKSSIEDLRTIVVGCLEGPYRFLRAVAEPMIAQGDGQIVLITSASAARPTPGAALYSSVRAGATMMARNLADEIAHTGVQVNALGTNFMDFPEFHRANGTDDPERRRRLEEMVPMKRMGRLDEFAAFAMAFLDGTSGFTTGQFVAYAGGWA